jgi:hypothetical protein
VPVAVAALTRSGPGMPYGAPQTASASADISALMNVLSIERSRSGDADSSCSCRNRAGPVLLGAVIADVFFRSTVRGLPKDHAMAALTRLRHAQQGRSAHHSGGRNSRGAHMQADPILDLSDTADLAEQVDRWLIQIGADAGLTGMEDLVTRMREPSRI